MKISVHAALPPPQNDVGAAKRRPNGTKHHFSSSAKKLKNSGAESIRRYERGADVDGQEKFNKYRNQSL